MKSSAIMEKNDWHCDGMQFFGVCVCVCLCMCILCASRSVLALFLLCTVCVNVFVCVCECVCLCVCVCVCSAAHSHQTAMHNSSSGYDPSYCIMCQHIYPQYKLMPSLAWCSAS